MFTNQKFETPIPTSQTPIGSLVIPTGWIPSTSSTTNLPKLDIPIPEPEPEAKSFSDNKEESVKHIIMEEPEIDRPMLNNPRPEFEAEYHFIHKGIMYQGYLNPTQEEEGYQKEIDTCIPGLKGDKLKVVKAAFVDSLHFYPKKDQDKFLWPWYEYTPRNSATAAYKTLSTRVMGFSTGSTPGLSTLPKPQPPWDKPKDQEEGNRGNNPEERDPNTPHGDQGEGGGGGGGGDRGGGGRGGPGGPPPRPQQPVAPAQMPSRIRRVKIKAPNIFNRDQEQTQIFLDQLYLVFKGDPDKCKTDDAKIATAMSYIEQLDVTINQLPNTILQLHDLNLNDFKHISEFYGWFFKLLWRSHITEEQARLFYYQKALPS